MRVYNFVDIFSGKVPFENKMNSSRGFVVNCPHKLDKDKCIEFFNESQKLPVFFENIAVYVFKVMEGPKQFGNYYRYRIRMYYELLSSTL